MLLIICLHTEVSGIDAFEAMSIMKLRLPVVVYRALDQARVARLATFD